MGQQVENGAGITIQDGMELARARTGHYNALPPTSGPIPELATNLGTVGEQSTTLGLTLAWMHKHQHLEQQQQCGGRFGYHGEALKMLTTRGFGLLGSLPESQSRVRCCVSCAVWCVLPQSKRLQCPLTMPHAADSTVVGRAFFKCSRVAWSLPPAPRGVDFYIFGISDRHARRVCDFSMCVAALRGRYFRTRAGH